MANKSYTSGELFGGAIPSDIKNIFRDKMKKKKGKPIKKASVKEVKQTLANFKIQAQKDWANRQMESW
jgi:hypothetical protein